MTVQVVDEGENLLRRRFDTRRTLDTERVGLGRGIDENGGEQNDDDDGYDDNGLEHCSLLGGVEVISRTNEGTTVRQPGRIFLRVYLDTWTSPAGAPSLLRRSRCCLMWAASAAV